jgi:hypothetical protein
MMSLLMVFITFSVSVQPFAATFSDMAADVCVFG